jgi:monothiol glutaredoxin
LVDFVRGESFDTLRRALSNHEGNNQTKCNLTFESDTKMNVNERIKDQLENNPVVLYMKGTPDFPQCGFSGQTVQVLNACGAKYKAVNIFEDPELREALKMYSNWPTYPQLYVAGELVGGCDIVTDLYQKGELKAMLSAVGGVEV